MSRQLLSLSRQPWPPSAATVKALHFSALLSSALLCAPLTGLQRACAHLRNRYALSEGRNAPDATPPVCTIPFPTFPQVLPGSKTRTVDIYRVQNPVSVGRWIRSVPRSENEILGSQQITFKSNRNYFDREAGNYNWVRRFVSQPMSPDIPRKQFSSRGKNQHFLRNLKKISGHNQNKYFQKTFHPHNLK